MDSAARSRRTIRTSDYIVQSRDAVDEVMKSAVAAGGDAVKDAAATQWGYFGHFADPDGYLWKVATGS